MTTPPAPPEPLGPEDLVALAEANAPTQAEVEAWVAAATRRRRAPHRRRRWATLPIAAAIAAGLVGVLTQLGPPGPVPLAPQAGWRTLQPGIDVVVEGQGVHLGPGEVQWSTGTLQVSVEPAAGHHLQIETPEARVQVVGTVFRVDRGPFGTEVQVDDGTVEVTCTLGPHHRIEAGERAVCAIDAPSALSFALAAGTTDPAGVLAAVASGLAHPQASERVQGELHALRSDALLQLGRTDEALQGAAHLDPDHPTQLAALRRVVRAGGGCAGAAGRALDRLATVDPAAAIQWAQCADDPRRAIEILDRVRPRASEAEGRILDAWRRALAP